MQNLEISTESCYQRDARMSFKIYTKSNKNSYFFKQGLYGLYGCFFGKCWKSVLPLQPKSETIK